MGIYGRSARFISLVFGVGAFLLFSAPRSAQAVYHNVNAWAWSGTTGWISMDCNNANTPGCDPSSLPVPGTEYGIDIDDTGNLSGWAWSSQVGWICFGSTCNGIPGGPTGTPVAPAAAADHYCLLNVACARYDANTGDVHGWAYVMSQTDGGNFRGWISLNCEDVGSNTVSPHSCAASEYKVRFNEGATQAEGQFSGYGWNGNGDNTGNGWIQFGCPAVPALPAPPSSGWPSPLPFPAAYATSCGAPPGTWGVTSGWVKTGWASIGPIEGIYSAWSATPGVSRLPDIPIAFKDFSAPANSTLRCVFKMSNNTYRQKIVLMGTRVARLDHDEFYTISATANDAVADSAGNPGWWSFSSQVPPDPPFGCEIQGVPSIRKSVTERVAVHPDGWTFSGPGGASGVDSIRAKYCLDGNAGTDPNRSYFLNADGGGVNVQCDTEGDLALTLLRARGVPVEVKCYDNIDNDANLQKDCAGGTPATKPDRNCRGITYLCIPHPSAAAPQPPRP